MTDLNIAFHELAREYRDSADPVLDRIKTVVASGWYILGREVSTFEENFAAYNKAKFCVGVASGTDAITLCLMAAEPGQGAEVITTAVTAFPTITAIQRAGCKAVPVDINPATGLLDPAKIEAAINANTAAIVPVHLYGQSCDMDAINAIADKHKLQVIEDCAQSTGATCKGNHTGTNSLAGCFSFYPTKNLGALGDGGAITTNSKTLHDKLKQLRNYGQTDRYTHALAGMNSRLDEIQAAVLDEKLKRLDDNNNRRRQIAAYYRSALKAVTPLSQEDYGVPCYHLFVIRTANRDELAKKLKAQGIGTLIHYPLPVHRQNAFVPAQDIPCPRADAFTREILSIPCYPQLTDSEVERVADCINNNA